MYYLDNAATTPLTKEVRQRIIDELDNYGNPSSVYSIGLKNKNLIDDTRENVRRFIGAPANSEIIFTSSGSAANCLAIEGLVNAVDKCIVLYSPTAHKSMLKCCEAQKYSHALKVNKSGFIDCEDLEHKLKKYYPDQIIVCYEAANSEIGTMQNVWALNRLIHKYHGITVIDFTGMIPYYKLGFMYFDCDVITFSGHKLHSLKGIGVMCKVEDIAMEPIIYGSQESGYFAGTENVIGIASLDEAIKNYKYDFVTRYQRDYLWEMIKEQIPDCYLVGTCNEYKRLPFNLFICFKGVNGSMLAGLLEKESILVSTGSACNNHSSTPSNTLVAIGMDEEDYDSCIRITFSGRECYLDLEYFCSKIKECVDFLRS